MNQVRKEGDIKVLENEPQINFQIDVIGKLSHAGNHIMGTIKTRMKSISHIHKKTNYEEICA